MHIRIQVKESSQKEVDDLFEAVLNLHIRNISCRSVSPTFPILELRGITIISHSGHSTCTYHPQQNTAHLHKLLQILQNTSNTAAVITQTKKKNSSHFHATPSLETQEKLIYKKCFLYVAHLNSLQVLQFIKTN